MIPKTIHYCWFGHNPLPEEARKCIESWRRYLPDYEIKEWNEDNFDVNMVQYTQEAYEARKYAFVSDYARFWILYNYGGLYFDTDVEIIKPLDEVIAKGPFMGCEQDYLLASNGKMVAGDGSAVNPGLGVAAEPGMEIYKEMLDKYKPLRFLYADGSHNEKTIVAYMTEILQEKGLVCEPRIQQVAGLYIYPREYFGPKDYMSGEVHLTEHTLTIHHYDASWRNKSWKTRVVTAIKSVFLVVLPNSLVKKILDLKHRKRVSGSYFGSAK